uniref:HAT C-terminal dimerisation domain-containing protein n=1 Tax=Latimeria chalumnae TaxID=7897 RepID=H3ANY7_LATCH
NGHAPLKLISPSCTRWLVMADCVERILYQFDKAASVEHCYSARLLAEMYKDETNFLYLVFLKPFLLEIRRVNNIFQLESGDALKIFRDLLVLYVSTLKRVVKPSVFRANSEKQLLTLDLQASSVYLSQEDADLGMTFRQKMEASKLCDAAKDAIVKRCIEFIKVLLTQYQLRLPESLDMLKKLELLNPKAILTDTKPAVTELPRNFFVCPTEVLESQWRNVSSCKFTEKENMGRFWIEVYEYTNGTGNRCFEEMALGAIRMLTLPISNAHVEKVFSHISFLKDESRNRMGLKLLS